MADRATSEVQMVTVAPPNKAKEAFPIPVKRGAVVGAYPKKLPYWRWAPVARSATRVVAVNAHNASTGSSACRCSRLTAKATAPATSQPSKKVPAP